VLGQIATALYFASFVLIVPVVGILGNTAGEFLSDKE
jgi:hypothetical protein